MKKVSFHSWKILLQENLTVVADINSKKMTILESALDLHAVIWIDENDELQIKPTWDCVISINSKEKVLTIRHVDQVFEN